MGDDATTDGSGEANGESSSSSTEDGDVGLVKKGEENLDGV
jgi:hypothetical protein